MGYKQESVLGFSKDSVTNLPVNDKSSNGSKHVTNVAGISGDSAFPFGAEITVNASLTKVAEFSGGGMIEIAVADMALDQFEIRGVTASGSEQTLYSSASDFTSPTGILVGTSGDLTTQAIGSGWFIINPSVQAISLYAASLFTGSQASGVTIYG